MTHSILRGTGKGPIRLLEIIGNVITGGMEVYARNLIANLPRDAFEVTCICPYESPYTQSLRDLGCQVYITPIHDDPLWRAVEMTAGVVRQHEIELIHANLANAHTLAGIVSGLTGVPAVATIHSRTIWVQELSVTRLADMHIITVCEEARMQALATGLSSETVRLIRNGVDLNRFRPDRGGAEFRRSVGIEPDTLLVGFVGRLSGEKGPDKFVHVASRIHQELPDVHFAIVGEGPIEAEINQLVQRLGLGHRIHLTGLRQEVEAVYPAFDLFVQTSRSEAMPLALLEAMASGVPAVAIAVGGVAELVEAGTTGLLVSPGDWPGVSSRYPGDWEGIACAATDLLRAPERLKRMGAAARARAEAKYDLRRTVAETADFFRQLARPSLKSIAPRLASLVDDKAAVAERRGRLKTPAASGRPRLSAVRPVDDR